MNELSASESPRPRAQPIRRFVVLEHDFPERHWDLLVEFGDVLHAWRLNERPAVGRRIAATKMADHRLMYLDFEGRVSGGRGSVSRVCSGRMQDDSSVDSFRLLDTTVAQFCRREDNEGELCWWVFE